MSNIRVALPIIPSAVIPKVNEAINVTPGVRLVINDTNGLLLLTPVKGYSSLVDMIDRLSPILIFIGIIISMTLLVTMKNRRIDISDPLFFGIILMLIIAFIFALPIPTQVYLSDGSTTQSLLVGINAYSGFSSVMYLVSAILLVMSTWLYKEPEAIENLYPDIDQLMSMTVMLKSEEETEQPENNEENE
ncbi:hypothetical protein [Vulcanisaeta souniana]|nr:hypothetical protein [Vulcanisaeta souniana]